MATHSSTLAWRNPGQRSLTGHSPCDHRVGHKNELARMHSCNQNVFLFFFLVEDFHGNPVAKTLPSNAAVQSLVGELRSQVPCFKKKKKSKTSNRSNIVINLIKTLKQPTNKKKNFFLVMLVLTIVCIINLSVWVLCMKVKVLVVQSCPESL